MKNIIYHQAVTRITSSFQSWILLPMGNPSKWFTYIIAYKLKVVWCVKEHGNRTPGRRSTPLPTEKMIQQWRKREEEAKLVTGRSIIYVKIMAEEQCRLKIMDSVFLCKNDCISGYIFGDLFFFYKYLSKIRVRLPNAASSKP